MATDGVRTGDGGLPYLPPLQEVEPRPVVPHVPTATVPTAADVAKISADHHRRAARRRRRGNRIVGRVMGVLMLAALGGAGWAGYHYFQKEDTGTSSGTGQPVGPAGAIGAAIDGVESLNNRYTGFDLLTGEPITLADVSPDEAVPTFVLGMSRSLGPWNGMERYVFGIDDLYELEPEAIGDWLSMLHGLPQDPEVAARVEAEGLLPPPGPGELVLAIRTEGGRVTRLVAVSVDAAVSVDVSA
jgi:hypothetical protein